MKQALLDGIPIVIVAEQKAIDLDFQVVKKTALVFKPNSNGYEYTSASNLNQDGPALFMLGSTCRKLKDLPDAEEWLAELIEHSPSELLLGHSAVHRQYPDPTKEDLLESINDDEFQEYKSKAHLLGCSIQTPDRFCPSHVFCDKLGNWVNHV